MRKTLIALSATLGAMTIAVTPAAAQYGYATPSAYGNSYNYNYGYNANSYAQVGVLMNRTMQLSERIREMDYRNRISRRDAYRLNRDLDQVRRSLQWKARNGLSYGEYRSTERQIAKIERKLWKEARENRRDWRKDRRKDRSDRYDRDDRYDREYRRR